MGYLALSQDPFPSRALFTFSTFASNSRRFSPTGQRISRKSFLQKILNIEDVYAGHLI